MLGRLRMSVKECIHAYRTIAAEILIGSRLRKVARLVMTGARYPSEVFEEAVKNLIREKLSDSDALLLEDKPPRCKVYVPSVIQHLGLLRY